MASLVPDLDKEVIMPRVPNNEISRKGVGDTKTPRTVFYLSIDDAISGLGEGLAGKTVYIYEPLKTPREYVYQPSSHENPFLTNEVWYVSTCQVRKVMSVMINRKIQDRKLRTYNPRLVERDFPKWSWSNLDRQRKMSRVVYLSREDSGTISLKPEITFYQSIKEAVKDLKLNTESTFTIYKPKDDKKLEVIIDFHNQLKYDKPIVLYKKGKISVSRDLSYKTVN